MKHYYIYYAPYLRFNEEKNELERKHKALSKEMPAAHFAKVAIKEIGFTLFIVLLLSIVLYCGFSVDGHHEIAALLISCTIFIVPGALICFGRLCDYDYYIKDDDKELIEKFFLDETAELTIISIAEKIKADQWRESHPLEEKCRLAMTKNPNYVADLIRYVKDKNL